MSSSPKKALFLLGKKASQKSAEVIE